MVLPLGDDNVRGGPPAIITVGLVALNIAAFLFEASRPPDALQSLVEAWGVIPREYAAARDLPPAIPLPFWTTLVTSMFLHGGWLHLGSNMLYLWIFGDNIEKTIGHARYFTFYLVCGFAAGLAHIYFNASSAVPTIGASGAISGVLGGYLVLFPRNRVRVLTRVGIVAVPAFLVLGLWILIQFVSQLGSLSGAPEESGVAYLAHIGGFVAGVVLIGLFAAGRRRRYAVV
jgi:membrane associated rhomboid family serine protease